MSVYDEKFYRLDTDNVTGAMVLMEQRKVDLSTVHISQGDDGLLTVTEKPQKLPVAAEPKKYELRPEGDLFRIYALRPIRTWGVSVGERGGLVSGPYNLSQRGDCWIAPPARVTGSATISGSALVDGDSKISSFASIGSNARIYSGIISGVVHVSDSAQVSESTIEAAGGGIYLSGRAAFDGSIIASVGDDDVHFAGCCVEGAHIRNEYELVSIFVSPWGWLDAFRGRDGGQRFSVGCQRMGSVDELRALGRRYQITVVQQEMLERFIALAGAARQGWLAEPEPPTKSGEAASDVAVVPAVVAQDLNQYGEDLSSSI